MSAGNRRDEDRGGGTKQSLSHFSDYDDRVADDAPLEDLLGDRALREIGALFAVDVEGVLRGVVTSDQVRRAIASAAASPGPTA